MYTCDAIINYILHVHWYIFNVLNPFPTTIQSVFDNHYYQRFYVGISCPSLPVTGDSLIPQFTIYYFCPFLIDSTVKTDPTISSPFHKGRTEALQYFTEYSR